MKKDDYGIPALFKQLDGMDKKMRNKTIRAGLRDGAKILAKEIKAKAPVDTNKLAKSVKVRSGKRKKDQISVEVVISGGHDDPMVGQVEFGNRYQIANPFIRRSVAAKTEDVVDTVEGSVRDAIGG